jgi:predicted NBD/HSP70 family sugar kinase
MMNPKSLRTNDMKEINRMSVLKTVKRGICSRAEISASLGMSKPAVSSLVDGLINEGLIREIGRGKSTGVGGKRPILLDFNANAGIIVAVYFNSGWCEIGLTDLSGQVITYTKKEMIIHKDYRKTLDQIVLDIMEMIQQIRSEGVQQPVLACGVAIKGLIDTKLGIMRYSATIPEWRDIPVKEYLGSSLNVPTFIENDARANTFAELSERDARHTIACVSVGNGIGTGIAIQNEVYRGAYDGAVTFAHTTVLDNGPLCGCGNRGCWEALASTNAFLKELGNRKKVFEGLEFAEVIQKYHEGDAVIRDVLINYTGYWIGVGIANILNIFNPEQIIIQGDITLAGEELARKIEDVAMSKTLPVSRAAELSFSRNSEMYQVKGAAAVVIKHFFTGKFHRDIWTGEYFRVGGSV